VSPYTVRLALRLPMRRQRPQDNQLQTAWLILLPALPDHDAAFPLSLGLTRSNRLILGGHN
jgi:hypothetical protein